MTDPVPAAAPGLPASTFDRRAFLATLAAAGVMTVGTEMPANAADIADHPDADLLALVALRSASVERQTVFDAQADEALDRLVPPKHPDALHWRRSDFMSICTDRTRNCAQYGAGDGAFYVYESHDFIEKLRKQVQTCRENPAQAWFGGSEQHLARMEEIIAAYDLFMVMNDEAEDACGLTAATQRIEDETVAIQGLEAAIARTPARTAAGVAAKARVLATSFADDVADLINKQLPAFIARDALDPRRPRSSGSISTWCETMVASLIVDAIRLGTAASADVVQPSSVSVAA